MEIDFPSVGQLLAAVPVLGLVLALLNVWMSSRNERRRSQPVVIVHKRGDLVFAKQVERWVAQCVLKNEGGGPAFNVTFGVEIKGVRFPYRMKPDDLRPSRQRVVASGAQLPEPNPVVPAGMEPGFSIFVSPLDKLGLGSTSEEDEVYWARYENPQGHTWETRNSADRAGTMKIRRVWKHGLRNWKDRRARERLNRRGSRSSARRPANWRRLWVLHRPRTTSERRPPGARSVHGVAEFGSSRCPRQESNLEPSD